jgi:hypothetical protein
MMNLGTEPQTLQQTADRIIQLFRECGDSKVSGGADIAAISDSIESLIHLYMQLEELQNREESDPERLPCNQVKQHEKYREAVIPVPGTWVDNSRTATR